MNLSQTKQTLQNPAICIFCALLWILISIALSLHSFGQIVYGSDASPTGRPALIPADSVRTAVQNATQILTVKIDATKAASKDNQKSLEFKQLIEAAVNADAADAANSGLEEENTLIWSRLNGRRVQAAESPESNLEIYAVSSPDGASIFLQNHADRFITLDVRTILPAGIYSGEQLTISPGDRSAQLKMQRLEGALLSAKKTLSKPVSLVPGQLKILKFTDSARAARAEYGNLQNRIHQMAAMHLDAASKLKRIFREAEPYFGGLSMNERVRGDSKRLGCIHRILLYTSQAESFQHNMIERKHGASDIDKLVMHSLEQLASDLSDTSAVLLGLVPQIENESSTPPITAENSNKHALITTSISRQDQENYSIRVSLSNTGHSPVTLVKIGLDISRLAPGTIIDPSDPAVFATLRPGQTARAIFQISNSGDEKMSRKKLRGDISYFAESSPAKLRPNLWQ